MKRFEKTLFWQSAPISEVLIHIIDFEIDRPPFFQRFALRDRQDLFDPRKKENDTITYDVNVVIMIIDKKHNKKDKGQICFVLFI